MKRVRKNEMSNTRQIAQRKFQQAISHLDIAGCDLYQVALVYEENHDEIAKQIYVLLDGINTCIELSKTISSTF